MFEHESQIEVASDGRVPPRVQQRVFERLVADDAAASRRGARLQRRVDEIVADYRLRLRERLGERKYVGLRDYMSEMRRAHAERRSPRAGDSSALAAQRTLRRAESLAALEGLDIRAAELKRLAARAHRRIARLMTRAEPSDVDVGRLVLPHDVPAAIRTHKANPWTIVTAPYAAQGRAREGWTNGVTFSRTVRTDKDTGIVGSTSLLADPDASDFDAGAISYYTRLGFWYQMPAAGLVEVWIEAQSAYASHYVDLKDEFGWSDATVRQRSYLTLQTVVADKADTLKRIQVSSFEKEHETDGTWEVYPIAEASTHWAHFMSSAAYKAGTWVWVRVGTENYDFILVNDAEVHSEMDFRWLFKTVLVEAS